MKPKDHVLREVVNDLRDIALKFHDTDQLRERLRGALAPLLDQSPAVSMLLSETQLARLVRYSRAAIIGLPWVDAETQFINLNDLKAAVACPTSADDARDAARYRHLRNKMCFSSSHDVLPTVTLSSAMAAPHHDVHNDWVSNRFEASVDTAVDADMARTEDDDE